MMSNIGILFYLKKRTNAKELQIPIYVRITVGKKRTEFSTGYKLEKEFWDTGKQLARGGSAEVRRLNAQLKKLKRKINETISYLKENREETTLEKIMNRLLGKKEKQVMLVGVFEEHNRKIAALVNDDYAPATIVRYQTTLKHITDFMRMKYQIRDIPVKEINFGYISEFEFYLRTVRKCNNNSAMKYIKNFGKIVRICMANGWITTNPFLSFRIKIKKVERVFLSPDELRLMALKTFDDVRLEQVRNIFLFSCYTGLAYIDISRLRHSALKKGIDGEQWIFTNRQKTGTPSHIPLLPFALTIVDQYKDHPECQKTGLLLPLLTNQKMNARLKDVAEKCGIKKPLTFHVARHTFATTITLQNGVPIESVSKMLGHTHISTTQHYAKILDVKVGEDMGLLKKKLHYDQFI